MYQTYLDRSVPHTLHRWLGTAGLVVLFLLRIVLAQGVSHSLLCAMKLAHILRCSGILCAVCSACDRIMRCYIPLTRRSVDAHAIYILNLLLAFLQPKFDPSLEADIVADNIEEGGEELPTTRQDASDEEFRPFVRRLPEWDFWFVNSLITKISYFTDCRTPPCRLSVTKATLIALFCTTSVIFDVPVYWPILLVYFCILFTITMKRQIKSAFELHY
jgi:hypothetical protein